MPTTPTNEILLFDGFCPESKLKGNQVPMRLNIDDFWESEVTGLQMTTFAPFAAILRWRGQGKFKQTKETAADYYTGLILTKASMEEGQEIFPDPKAILSDPFDLKQYLTTIYKSEAAFHQSDFKADDPILKQQIQHLETIATEEWVDLVELFKQIQKEGTASEDFDLFHQKLYDTRVIFDFKWQQWQEGIKSLHHPTTDFSNCTLLVVSMYLTLIFRKDRFEEGTLERCLKSGHMDKLFKRLEQIT